jgi:hypothetical protein
VKSPKVDELKFEPGAAFDRLRTLARSLFAVPKEAIDKALAKEKRKKIAPPRAGR